uniref:Roadblock/LAMTOR2 domain-containing protein n=1 Tax=uncultured myxobacterium HF0130_06F04 TaxID=723555 RepID=E7C2F5_9BACT|nr:hypothetical protein [uncultured myxobacterium HF0130_06F04]
MMAQSTIMVEEDLAEIKSLCAKLHRDANARAVILVDRNGQFITGHGEVEQLDITSLASLTAGTIAATSGLARLIGEREFPHILHEGERDHLHLSLVAQRAILVVMFDRNTTLGLVRLRIRQVTRGFEEVFAVVGQRERTERPPSPLAGITEAEIDSLFS